MFIRMFYTNGYVLSILIVILLCTLYINGYVLSILIIILMFYTNGYVLSILIIILMFYVPCILMVMYSVY